ncbi:MAG: LCP family protein [Acetobacteraceae bacterium]|nr:LCP family protein [Acetobacteraceae bacterium]
MALWVAGGLLALVLALGGTLYGLLHGLQTPQAGPRPVPSPLAQIDPGERINVVFLGMDAGADLNPGVSKRTDTVILASFDPKAKTVGLLSLPRDTRVAIPGRPTPEKLCHANAYGHTQPGPDLGPQLVRETLEGFLHVPVHYYVRLDFRAFARVVDILGGVEVDVPQRMYYEDPAQGLKIDLLPGRQVLDGEKALQFVRYRQYHDADLGRIRAQQTFLKALFEKAFRLRNVFKVPALAVELARYVDTDLSVNEMITLGRWALELEPDDVSMEVLPGEAANLVDGGKEAAYFLADPVGTVAVVNRVLRGVDPAQNAGIRVEVLNGTGRSGLARGAAQLLGDMGFVVAGLGDAGTGFTETVLIPRSSNEVAVQAAGRAMVLLGTRPSVRSSGPGGTVDVDVTVVVGSDLPTSLLGVRR